ncbi:MAG: STAS domain-containing protein [Terriglobales bacterium]
MTKSLILVKQLPRCRCRARRRSFLSEIQDLAKHSYRPQLVVDLSNAPQIEPDAIDLLLECVEQVERADGRVSVAVGSPETAVLLELTRLNSVLDIFSSVSEAVGDNPSHRLGRHDGLQDVAA